MSDLVKIGKITSPHGIKGEVKFFCLGETQNLEIYKEFYIDEAIREISFRGQKDKTFIAQISGIEDRNQAEELKGKEVYVASEALPKLKSNNEFLYSLISIDNPMREGFNKNPNVSNQLREMIETVLKKQDDTIKSMSLWTDMSMDDKKMIEKVMKNNVKIAQYKLAGSGLGFKEESAKSKLEYLNTLKWAKQAQYTFKKITGGSEISNDDDEDDDDESAPSSYGIF